MNDEIPKEGKLNVTFESDLEEKYLGRISKKKHDKVWLYNYIPVKHCK